MCCLITSNESVSGIPISNRAMQEGRLPFKSWVKPHRLFTIDTRIVRKRLGRVNKEFHEKIVHEILQYIESSKE